MAGNANLVVVMGNLTRDPEIRHTAKGRAVTTLSIAVNRVYTDRDSGERVEDTDFINVVVWGKQAENCVKYLSKGRPVYVEGRLTQNRWETPEGETRSRLEVTARNVQFLGSAPSSQGGARDYPEKVEPRQEDIEESMDEDTQDSDEEIPF